MNPPRSHPLSSALILFFFVWIEVDSLLQDGHANLWSLIVLMRMPSLGATSTYRKRKSNQSSACPLFSTTPWRCHFSPSFLPSPSPTFLAHSYLYFHRASCISKTICVKECTHRTEWTCWRSLLARHAIPIIFFSLLFFSFICINFYSFVYAYYFILYIKLLWQMAISLENIKFLHEQIREQSEKMR